jgi:hypothetical protein
LIASSVKSEPLVGGVEVSELGMKAKVLGMAQFAGFQLRLRPDNSPITIS